MKAPALKCFPTREAKGAPLRPVVQSTEMGVSDLMEVLSPKLDLMSSVPGSNAWEAASASAFPFPGSSKQSSESLPSGPIPSAQATAAKNLYSRPLVGSTSRFQAEPKQSIYPNQLANQTRAPPWADFSFCSSAYGVLATVSSCCSPPKGRFLRVTHPSATGNTTSRSTCMC